VLDRGIVDRGVEECLVRVLAVAMPDRPRRSLYMQI
jgi:hypothetical protein